MNRFHFKWKKSNSTSLEMTLLRKTLSFPWQDIRHKGASLIYRAAGSTWVEPANPLDTRRSKNQLDSFRQVRALSHGSYAMHLFTPTTGSASKTGAHRGAVAGPRQRNSTPGGHTQARPR